MSDDSRVATITVSIIQIFIPFFQVLRILFSNGAAACSTLGIALLGPDLLIAMLFQPSGVGDRHVLNPERWHHARILLVRMYLHFQFQKHGRL